MLTDLRELRNEILVAAILIGAVCRFSSAADPDAAHRWDIRRLRTVDADKAGRYPEWRVTQSQATPGVNVEIEEGDTKARGTILIGKELAVPADRMLRIHFAFTTYCGLDHRSGSLALAIFDPGAWKSLPTEPKTEKQSGSEGTRPLWQWQVHSMSDPDVTQLTPVDEDSANALAQALRTYAGRRMVVAISWTGAHTTPERAAFSNLHIEEGPAMLAQKQLIEALDLQRPELKDVAEAAAEGDTTGAMRELLRHFRQRWPDPPQASGIQGSRQDAIMALENRFRSIGSDQYYKLREDFDWDRNAIGDKEWLSHLQWHDILVTLVTTASVTGDERFLAKAADLIRDWIPRNYPGARWSWRTLEVSLRAMKWARIYPYLLHYEDFTLEDHASFLLTLEAHLDYLLPEERFHSGHNFGASECKALLHVSIVFPEFDHAKQWRQTAWTRFEGEMTDQVLPDGAQKELTCGYHNGVMNTFFTAAQWVEGTDLTPSETYWSQLEKMHEYTAYLTKPDGSQPNVGDTWKNSQGDLVERGGVFFDRPDLVFIGSYGLRGDRPDYLDRELPAAGYYAMRTSWPDDPDGIYLFVDAARHWGGWHSHYDALGIILYAYGRTLTPDAGPFAYGNPLRDKFQSTAFHSTVSVDQQNQNREGCRIHAFESDARLSFLDAEHPGYEHVSHRRQILFVRPEHGMPPYFLIVDRLLGTETHQLDLHFHLPPGEVTTDQSALTAATAAPDAGNLKIVGLQTGNVTLTPQTSWIMTGYGKKTDRPDICFTKHADMPALFATVLIPFKGKNAPLLKAAILEESRPDGPVAVTVTSDNGTQDLLFLGTDAAGATLGKTKWSGRAGLERTNAAGKYLCRVLFAAE